MRYSIEKTIGGGSFSLIIRDKRYENVEGLSYDQRDALEEFIFALERDVREQTKSEIRDALGIKE